MTTKNEFRGAYSVSSEMECEEALVGALLVEPQRVADAIGELSPQSFQDRDLGDLFGAILALHESGCPVTDTTLLRKHLNGSANRWPLNRLIALVKKGSLWWHAGNHAEVIEDAARRRRLLAVADGIREQVEDGMPSHEIAEWIGGKLEDYRPRETDVFRTMADSAREVMSRIGKSSTARCLFTGLSDVDSALTLLMPSEYIVLAARTSEGKTAIAKQIAMHNALHGRPVLFVSLEMEDTELATRELCAESGVSADTIRRKSVGEFDRLNLIQAAESLQGVPFWIYRPKRQADARRIMAVAKRAKREHKIELLVVDYIGKIKPADLREPRYEQVTKISAALKNMAIELALPLVALCQLNRDADSQRPTLAMLRESGAIEQDADSVVFLHKHDNEHTELIVAKGRNIGTGEFWLRFDRPRTTFERTTPPEKKERTKKGKSKFDEKMKPSGQDAAANNDSPGEF